MRRSYQETLEPRRKISLILAPVDTVRADSLQREAYAFIAATVVEVDILVAFSFASNRLNDLGRISFDLVQVESYKRLK